MIKKIKTIFQPYMVRPMIYQCVTRIAVALVLALLWDRWVNVDGFYSVVEDAFFIEAVFFFMLAWIHYLRLDGIRLRYLMTGSAEKKKKAKRSSTRDIADFADEKIISFAELEDDERIVCRLLGNLICTVFFLVPSLIAMVV